MRPRGAARGVALAVLAACLALPLAAQQEEDEDLERQRQEDERYRQRYASPSPEKPKDTDRAALEHAFTLIRDANHRALRTPNVALDTDDPRIDLRAVERLVSATNRLFEAVLRGRVDLAPDPAPAQVFLFWSYADYNQLLGGSFSRSLLRPKGHYGTIFDAVALHTDSDQPGGLGDTIVHELSHRLVDKRLYAGSGMPPPWLGEGLAEYFGRTRIDEHGAFEPGVVGGKAGSLFSEGKGRMDAADSKSRLRELAQALERGERAIGSEIVRADPARYYGEATLGHYAASWILVHWLLHAEDSARTAGFFQYLALDRRGAGNPDAFFRTVGIAESDLDVALAAHIPHVKVR
jgi:Protein of unknown function (DUF1570)